MGTNLRYINDAPSNFSAASTYQSYLNPNLNFEYEMR